MSHPSTSRDLSQMDEEQLVRLARRNRFEQACHDSGCLIGLVFGVFFCWLAIFAIPLGESHWATFFRVTVAMVSFVGAPIIAQIALRAIANRRTGIYQKELARRYLSLHHGLFDEIQSDLAEDEVALCYFVDRATAREDGTFLQSTTVEFRVLRFSAQLDASQRPGCARTFVQPGALEPFDFGSPNAPWEQLARTEQPLMEQQTHDLATKWQKLPPLEATRQRPNLRSATSDRETLMVVLPTGTPGIWFGEDEEDLIKNTAGKEGAAFLRCALEIIKAAGAPKADMAKSE